MENIRVECSGISLFFSDKDKEFLKEKEQDYNKGKCNNIFFGFPYDWMLNYVSHIFNK